MSAIEQFIRSEFNPAPIRHQDFEYKVHAWFFTLRQMRYIEALERGSFSRDAWSQMARYGVVASRSAVCDGLNAEGIRSEIRLIESAIRADESPMSDSGAEEILSRLG